MEAIAGVVPARALRSHAGHGYRIAARPAGSPLPGRAQTRRQAEENRDRLAHPGCLRQSASSRASRHSSPGAHRGIGAGSRARTRASRGSGPIPFTAAAPAPIPVPPAAEPPAPVPFPTLSPHSLRLEKTPSAPIAEPQPAAAASAPAQILHRIRSLDGVTGAFLATADGLLIAADLPDGNENILAAFAPTVFSQLAKYSELAHLGLPDAIDLHLAAASIHVRKAGRNFLGVLTPRGRTLPLPELNLIYATLQPHAS